MSIFIYSCLCRRCHFLVALSLSLLLALSLYLSRLWLGIGFGLGLVWLLKWLYSSCPTSSGDNHGLYSLSRACHHISMRLTLTLNPDPTLTLTLTLTPSLDRVLTLTLNPNPNPRLPHSRSRWHSPSFFKRCMGCVGIFCRWQPPRQLVNSYHLCVVFFFVLVLS